MFSSPGCSGTFCSETQKLIGKKMRKKTVYISAPIGGYEDTAEDRFAEAERILQKHGFKTVNPYMKGCDKSWGDCMIDCLKKLKKCDMICMCEGWRDSKGCDIERRFARGIGIDVVFLENYRDDEIIS